MFVELFTHNPHLMCAPVHAYMSRIYSNISVLSLALPPPVIFRNAIYVVIDYIVNECAAVVFGRSFLFDFQITLLFAHHMDTTRFE